MPKTKWLLLSALIAFGMGVSALGVLPTRQDEDEQSRRDFMRMKLNFSQLIVEGLSVQDFKLIANGASEIKKITEADQWMALDTPEYKRYSAEMRQAADRLTEMANEKNLEGAALRYFDLTLKCIDCHQHIKNRIF